MRVLSKNFEAKKIYNLGELTAPYKWGIYGAHQDWDAENSDMMFKVAENVYAAKNVKLADNGFKFVNREKDITYVEPNNPEYNLYLKPNGNRKEANARFAAYFFGDGETWVSMTKIDNNTWGVNKPTNKTYPNVIFCRMNPSTTANNWDNGVKWNQTSDLTCPTDGTNCYTVKDSTWDKGGGTWGTITVDNTPYWDCTDFGAWKDSGSGYFNYSTVMSVGAWYEVADNNLGGQSYNIGVTDFTKTYDIYIKESVETWGSLLNYTVVEHGTEVTF